MRSRTVFAAAALAVTFVIAAQAGQNYATPQEVFQAAREAVKKEDYKAFSSCLTEESRDTMAGGVTISVLFLKGFAKLFAKGDDARKVEEAIKQLDDVLNKHGLTEETLAKMKDAMPGQGAKDPASLQQAVKALVQPIKDKTAYLSDIFAALKKLDQKKDGGPLPGDAQLKDVKIDGDSARGEIVTKQGDKEKSEPIYFKKVGGGWKIDLPLDKILKIEK